MMQNQNHSGIGDNVARDKYEYHYHNIHKVPTQLTSKLGQDSIIGRIEELKKVDTLLNKSASLLLISGIGGIGKSTIASYYLHTQKENFDYYGFFEGIDSFISELREPLALRGEKEEELFFEALSKLRVLEGKKLLVFDDCNVEENRDRIKKISGLKNSGYKILFTSREKLEGIVNYHLDILSLSDAKRLFNSIVKISNENLLEEVLAYLDYHPYFVELTARTLLSKKTLTLEEISQKFENGEFSKISRKRKDNFNNYLNKLFTFDMLDEEEYLILKQFSILPSINIDFRFLQKIFARQDEDFEEILNYLSEKGWLTQDKNYYKIHQITKEYILANHPPVFNEIELQVDYFSELINLDDIEIISKNKHKVIYFESIIKILDFLGTKHLKVIKFFLSVGNLHYAFGNYLNAEYLFSKSALMSQNLLGEETSLTAEAYTNMAAATIAQGRLEESTETFLIRSINIKEKIFKEDSSKTTLSYSYNHLASFYKLKGDYDKSQLIYSKALELSKKMFGNEHLDTATSNINLAEAYRIIGHYDKAEPLYFDALKVKKKLLGEVHPSLAIIYNNLALLYTAKKNYSKADFLYQKSLSILKDTWGEAHPDTANAYHNLAFFYSNIHNYEKAEKNYLKAIELKEKTLGKEHPNTAMSYDNLATVYMSSSKHKKAKFFLDQAFTIRQKILGEEHPDIATSYHNLAYFYMMEHKKQKAYVFIKKAVEIGKKVLPIGHPDLIGSQNTLEELQSFMHQPIEVLTPNINRNAPCPCNSGRKYKKCCGKN
ncbi:MAG TPA: tetratricopeptide repeat protein [Arcobacter sp.]|nr:tetratricopeptide repeat protein [Arcobacter sp.]